MNAFQTGLFTSEQMTGSGQLNMLDQIAEAEGLVSRSFTPIPAYKWHLSHENDPEKLLYVAIGRSVDHIRELAFIAGIDEINHMIIVMEGKATEEDRHQIIKAI